MIPPKSPHSFFLWGPRQTGKSTYLKQRFPSANYIDLLDSQIFRSLTENPSLLREKIQVSPQDVVILDEIQKVPPLLDEVQRLIVNEKIRFGLCGSSARKLRRGHANLLGGRALRYEMFGLVSGELGSRFDIQTMANRGNLPVHYFSDECPALLRAYVADYLKEEIAAEGLVRNLPSFSQFLDLSALSDCELVSYSSFARDVGVAVNTVREYFQILIDTLLCRYVSAYTKRAKRRTVNGPKFYFDNVGIVNSLSRRSNIEIKSEAFGKAFENIICHELHAHSSYTGNGYDISYWRLTTGVEVDFVLGDMHTAIECKASSKIHSDHLKNLRQLAADFPKVKRRIVVSLESSPRKTDDQIEILPVQEFLKALWAGEFI
jgi:uncharacterized protein